MAALIQISLRKSIEKICWFKEVKFLAKMKGIKEKIWAALSYDRWI
jgi:hypothetical protein